MRFGSLVILSTLLFTTPAFSDVADLSMALRDFGLACDKLELATTQSEEMLTVSQRSRALREIADRLADNAVAGVDYVSMRVATQSLLRSFSGLRSQFEARYKNEVAMDRTRLVGESILEAWYEVAIAAAGVEEALNSFSRPSTLSAPKRYIVEAKLESRFVNLKEATRKAIYDRCMVKFGPEAGNFWKSVTIKRRVWNAPMGRSWGLEKVCAILALNARVIDDDGKNIRFTLAGITAENAPYYIREREMHEMRYALQDLMPILMDGDQKAFSINGRRIVRDYPIGNESMVHILFLNIVDGEKKYRLSGDLDGYPFFLNVDTLERAEIKRFFSDFHDAFPLGFNVFRLGDEQFVNDDTEDEQWDIETITDEVIEMLEE